MGKTYVNNIFTEMRNAVAQNATTPQQYDPVLGRRIRIPADLAVNTLLIDPDEDSAVALNRPLGETSTHINWSVESDGAPGTVAELWVTIDGTDPAITASGNTSRFAISSDRLGSIWHKRLTEQVKFAVKSGAPIFTFSEMHTI